MLRYFINDLKAWVSVGGKLCETFGVKNEVKQENVPVTTPFDLYRTSGNLFNIKEFETAVSVNFMQYLYAYYYDLVAHTEGDMQRLLDALISVFTALGITINLK